MGVDLGSPIGPEIRQAPDLAECFDLLVAGRVDAVVADEFSGVKQLFDQGLTDSVVPLPRPLGAQTLHVVTSKSHWRATTMLYRFNAGLAELKKSGAYQEILARHVSLFWQELE